MEHTPSTIPISCFRLVSVPRRCQEGQSSQTLLSPLTRGKGLVLGPQEPYKILLRNTKEIILFTSDMHLTVGSCLECSVSLVSVPRSFVQALAHVSCAPSGRGTVQMCLKLSLEMEWEYCYSICLLLQTLAPC